MFLGRGVFRGYMKLVVLHVLRGWCWWYGRYPYILAHPYVPWWSREDEARYLEELKKYLTESVLKEIDKRLEELKK